MYVGNLGGGIRTVKNVRRLAESAAWFNADHQGRSGDTPIWDCAQQGAWRRPSWTGRAITNVTGAYSNSQPDLAPRREIAAETTMWMAQTTASGMVPWFHWLGGAPEDTVGRVSDAILPMAGRQRAAFPEHPDGRGSRRPVSAADHRVLSIRRGRSRANQRLPAGSLLRAPRGPLPLRFRARGSPLARIAEQVPCAASSQRGDTCPTSLRRRFGHMCDRAVRSWPRSNRPVMARGESLAAISRWRTCSAPTSTARSSAPPATVYMRIDERHPVTRGFDGTALLPGAESRVPIRRFGCTSSPDRRAWLPGVSAGNGVPANTSSRNRPPRSCVRPRREDVSRITRVMSTARSGGRGTSICRGFSRTPSTGCSPADGPFESTATGSSRASPGRPRRDTRCTC